MLTPSVSIDAPSVRHGAALALRELVKLGCDVTAAHAHVDVQDADGATHTVLAEELIDWLSAPEQAAFVEREGLETLVRADAG